MPAAWLASSCVGRTRSKASDSLVLKSDRGFSAWLHHPQQALGVVDIQAQWGVGLMGWNLGLHDTCHIKCYIAKKRLDSMLYNSAIYYTAFWPVLWSWNIASYIAFFLLYTKFFCALYQCYIAVWPVLGSCYIVFLRQYNAICLWYTQRCDKATIRCDKATISCEKATTRCDIWGVI